MIIRQFQNNIDLKFSLNVIACRPCSIFCFVIYKVSECDYYIKHHFDDENDKHSRYHYIAQISQNQFTKVISFNEFLAILDLNETKLKELPIPQVVESQHKQRNHIEEAHVSVSLGEILRQCGIEQ